MFTINIFDENILLWIKGFFINILLAILIITIMVLLAKFVKKLIYLYLQWKYSYIDTGTEFTILTIFNFCINCLLVGIVLYLFGVPSTFLTVLISSGIALAVASDLVFGFNFFLRLPFKVGDKIEIYNTGIVGRVMEINIAQSKIVIDDKKDIIISNRKLLENILIIHKLPNFDEKAQGHK